MNAEPGTLQIPELSLVVLIGASGSGKSLFAKKHFKPTEVLSSDFCRGLVSDDENDQSATNDAFAVLHFVAATRLAAGRLTVVDATNVQLEARKPLVALARRYHALPVAIVLDLPERVCQERNRGRAERGFGPHVVRQQVRQLHRALRGLRREGFRFVYVLESAHEVESAVVQRIPLWTNKTHEHGPFDVIGDIHGCCSELEALLSGLGYRREAAEGTPAAWRHPEGRKAVFLGDLFDRGPRILDTYRLVRDMVRAGSALCLPGNHEAKLARSLGGRNVQITHGLGRTLAELDALPEAEAAALRAEIAEFIDGLVGHYVLDDGKLVVAHAGMREDMQGRGSGKVRDFALYGETTGESDEFGLPVRNDWAADYRGKAMVVYGHTPVPEAEWLNRTINIDTGCVFGGNLTALRYPEQEIVSVPAAATYFEPAKPFLPEGAQAPVLSAQQVQDDVLDIEDVLGKRIVPTRLHRTVSIREENAAAALEVMSRFAVNPKWLIYLPPTMSPCETSAREGFLERPEEAFAYFRDRGIPRVVCERKHMGSRAVLAVCRDEEAARRGFGVTGEEIGACVTRTGRPFFSEGRAAFAEAVLDRLRKAVGAAGLWEDLRSDWFLVDAELLPWSAKAQALLEQQYAAVGAAAGAAMPEVVAALEKAAALGEDAVRLLAKMREREDRARRYVNAYSEYCWPVRSVEDLKVAPFHLLAGASGVYADRNHVWHMETLARICRADPGLLLETPYRVVDVTNEAERVEGVRWWEELTDAGGEGMVVKPYDFIARGSKGLLQPALKCRGKEYLRIIYGPEYDLPGNIERLRSRALAGKRSLALREFALGIEGLERFVRREPLRRVHECVFAVLALESEPVDPRL
ncbi:MAG TPA: polynucleotide kinase-phosphatase [Planctomycetes bacterium]|nr:polynucleotide kinase-phosphatase [Planctomycetota bacterium]